MKKTKISVLINDELLNYIEQDSLDKMLSKTTIINHILKNYYKDNKGPMARVTRKLTKNSLKILGLFYLLDKNMALSVANVMKFATYASIEMSPYSIPRIIRNLNKTGYLEQEEIYSDFKVKKHKGADGRNKFYKISVFGKTVAESAGYSDNSHFKEGIINFVWKEQYNLKR